MTHIPLGLVIEGLVAVLLVLTIVYCAILNKRLKRLRSDEQALRATISELITTTEIAERAILGLKTTAGDCDKTIGARLSEAERLSGELATQIATGDAVLGRITQIAEAAKPAQAATHHAVRRAAAVPGAVATTATAGSIAGEPMAPTADTSATKSVSAQDLRLAAAEAAARLERFRQRSGERAA